MTSTNKSVYHINMVNHDGSKKVLREILNEESEVEMVHNDLYSPEKFKGFYHTLGRLEPKSRRVQLTHSCAAWSERFNFGSTDLWFNGTEAFVH